MDVRDQIRSEELRVPVTPEIAAAVSLVRMRRDGYSRAKARLSRVEYSRSRKQEKDNALQMVREAEQDLADLVLAELERIGA